MPMTGRFQSVGDKSVIRSCRCRVIICTNRRIFRFESRKKKVRINRNLRGLY
ncbi:unnamed protein product [Tenebrio molitor]|nr:unnamed protein product [Tenebrio molitor]